MIREMTVEEDICKTLHKMEPRSRTKIDYNLPHMTQTWTCVHCLSVVWSFGCKWTRKFWKCKLWQKSSGFTFLWEEKNSPHYIPRAKFVIHYVQASTVISHIASLWQLQKFPLPPSRIGAQTACHPLCPPSQIPLGSEQTRHLWWEPLINALLKFLLLISRQNLGSRWQAQTCSDLLEFKLNKCGVVSLFCVCQGFLYVFLCFLSCILSNFSRPVFQVINSLISHA